MKTVAAFGLVVAGACTALLVINKGALAADNRVVPAAMTSLLFALLLYAAARRTISLRVAAALLPALLLYELYQGTGFAFAPYEDQQRNATTAAIRGNQDIAD